MPVPIPGIRTVNTYIHIHSILRDQGKAAECLAAIRTGLAEYPQDPSLLMFCVQEGLRWERGQQKMHLNAGHELNAGNTVNEQNKQSKQSAVHVDNILQTAGWRQGDLLRFSNLLVVAAPEDVEALQLAAQVMAAHGLHLRARSLRVQVQRCICVEIEGERECVCV